MGADPIPLHTTPAMRRVHLLRITSLCRLPIQQMCVALKALAGRQVCFTIV